MQASCRGGGGGGLLQRYRDVRVSDCRAVEIGKGGGDDRGEEGGRDDRGEDSGDDSGEDTFNCSPLSRMSSVGLLVVGV